jgi:hypothetical protein
MKCSVRSFEAKAHTTRCSRLISDKTTFRNIKANRTSSAKDDVEVHFVNLQLAGMDASHVFRPRYLPSRVHPTGKSKETSTKSVPPAPQEKPTKRKGMMINAG